jgi:hypothetical protein
MSYRVFDYQCRCCGSVSEEWISHDDEAVPCRVCEGVTDRLPTTPNICLDGCDPGFPRAWRRWGDWKSQQGGPPERKTEF